MGAIDQYQTEQLKLLEAEVLRQRDRMKERMSGAGTRAAVLIGVAGALGGTELVTVSGSAVIGGISLFFYFAAAVLGLLALTTTWGPEVDLQATIDNNTTSSPARLQRSTILANVSAHEGYEGALRVKTILVGIGFGALIAAWLTSGIGTLVSLNEEPKPAEPTKILIEGDVVVDVKP